MPRYIDADALIDRVTRMWESRQITNTKYKCIADLLTAEPTADVVERKDIEAECELAYKHGWSDCFADHRWIPVTERLPEKDGMFLVSISPSSRLEKRVDTDFYSHFGIWQIFGKFVTAWMPLPKPYERSEDDTRKETEDA